jgi:protein gp37
MGGCDEEGAGMMNKTGINWTDMTWNPVTGCTKVGWIGVTVENQEMADARIPLLLAVPAKKYFVSVEPMLGPIHLRGTWMFDAGKTKRPLLNWVVVGGETGPGARPIHPEWVCYILTRCRESGVPFWFKQWGEWLPESQIDKYNHDQYPRFGRANFGTLGRDGYFCEGRYPSDRPMIGDECVYRLGKARAGRILDGREWSERP